MANVPNYDSNDPTVALALKGKKILSYPLGLGNTYKDSTGREIQYMLFKINTPTAGSTLRDDGLGSQVVTPLSTSQMTGVQTLGRGDAAQNENIANADSDIATKYDTQDITKTTWVQKKGMSRLDRAVVLPMPNDHNVNTAVGYNQNYDPGILSKAGDMWNNMSGQMAMDVAKLVGTSAVSGLVNKLVSGVTSQQQLLAAEKIAVNPKKEVMFEGFNFRNFTFQYVFAPKNEEESKMVTEIIETFRYYSLPEISPSKMFYIFPSEFEVSFMLGSRENPNIPRMTTSVLQRVGVNYSPAGQSWATLPNGAPVSLTMTLEFIELELVDRSRIYNKLSPITSGY